MERAKGFEPSTSSLGSGGVRDLSEADKGLRSTDPDACTAACTSDAENANEGPLGEGPESQGGGGEQLSGALAAVARLIGSLTPADRERLAAMLAGSPNGE